MAELGNFLQYIIEMSDFWQRVDEELDFIGKNRTYLANKCGFSLANIGKGIKKVHAHKVGVDKQNTEEELNVSSFTWTVFSRSIGRESESSVEMFD